MEHTAYVVAMVIGCITVLTACVVWYRKQAFGVGGAALSMIGVVLIGLSVFNSIQFKMLGVEAELSKMEKRIESVAGASEAVSEELTKIADISEAVRTQFAGLTRTLETAPDPSPEEMEKFRTAILGPPAVDKGKLEGAQRVLKPLPVGRIPPQQ